MNKRIEIHDRCVIAAAGSQLTDMGCHGTGVLEWDHIKVYYSDIIWASWVSYQIDNIASCACAGNAGNAANVSPATDFKGNRKLAHVPWCMSGSLTRGGGENVPGIPGAGATRNFTYLVRSPWRLNLSATP